MSGWKGIVRKVVHERRQVGNGLRTRSDRQSELQNPIHYEREQNGIKDIQGDDLITDLFFDYSINPDSKKQCDRKEHLEIGKESDNRSECIAAMHEFAKKDGDIHIECEKRIKHK